MVEVVVEVPDEQVDGVDLHEEADWIMLELPLHE